MPTKIFLDQLKRSKKTGLYLGLLLIAAAFFVTSVNLYHNSSGNLKVAEEAFSTLAVTELYGEVDCYGQLVERNSQEHIGYKAVGVRGYDFSPLIDSNAVESWDLRTYYGAYIPGLPAMSYRPGASPTDKNAKQPEWQMRSTNIIRFKITSTEPLRLTYHPFNVHDEKYGFIGWDVLDEAAGSFLYPERIFYNNLGFRTQEDWDAWAEDIKRVNRSQDTDSLILYPDVEYVAILNGDNARWLRTGETDQWVYNEAGASRAFKLTTPYQDATNIRLTYDNSKEEKEYQWGYSPFPLQRWEDVQSDPQLKAYFEALWQNI